MDSGITEIATRSGSDVIVIERNAEVVKLAGIASKSRFRVRSHLARYPTKRRPLREAAFTSARTSPHSPTHNSSLKRSPKTRRPRSKAPRPSMRSCGTPTPHSPPTRHPCRSSSSPRRRVDLNKWSAYTSLTRCQSPNSSKSSPRFASAETTAQVHEFANGPRKKCAISSAAGLVRVSTRTKNSSWHPREREHHISLKPQPTFYAENKKERLCSPT
jgi:hypothetical protein